MIVYKCYCDTLGHEKHRREQKKGQTETRWGQ